MRWRRGFFRLWLLIAVLWISIGVYVNFSGSPYFPELRIAIKQNGQIVALKPWSEETKILEAAAEGGLSERHVMLVYPGGATYYADAGDDVPTQSSKLQKVSSYLEAEGGKDRVGISNVLPEDFPILRSLLPPLLLLALGSALAWVLMGFRRSPNQL